MTDASRLATSSLVPRVDARARCAAASPPDRRSQELSGGGCNPVPEPSPASPRLIAGLSSSASAGPIGCTSGLDALEFGALDFGVLPGFLGRSGFFAMAGIWGESDRRKRGNAMRGHIETPMAAPQSALSRSTVSRCQRNLQPRKRDRGTKMERDDHSKKVTTL